MWRFPCEFRWDSWIKYVSDFITTHNSRTAKYYGWRRRDYFCSTLSVAKKQNKKTKQKSVAHLKLSFYSLEPFCLSMSCRRHCPPSKNGVEHQYLVTLESSIDSSSLSQPLRSKPDMQQSTFDTSRRLVIKHFSLSLSLFHFSQSLMSQFVEIETWYATNIWHQAPGYKTLFVWRTKRP